MVSIIMVHVASSSCGGRYRELFFVSFFSVKNYPMLSVVKVQMYSCCGGRYHELFFMIDTCQAESMFQKFYSPNILAIASSRVGEDSLSVSTASVS